MGNKITPNTERIIEEKYRETLFKKIKKRLYDLIDKKTRYDDKLEIGFQNGWNDALEHFSDIELEDIK